MDKMNYEKPTAVDLGPTARIVGASCAPGEEFDPTEDCASVGNGAVDDCYVGNSAADVCQDGNSASSTP